MPLSLPIIRYVLKAALRDKIFFALIAMFALVVSLSIFSGSAAIVESPAFSLVFAAGGMRLAGVMGLVLFICFFIRRSFEAGDIELMLARPFDRVQFVFSYAAAFFVMALFVAFLQAITVYGLTIQEFTQAHLLWVISLAVENLIISMVAFFFSMVLSNAAICAFATFAFYVLARMIGQFLGIAATGVDLWGHAFLNAAIKVISLIIPRLDMMGQTSWLVYGLEHGIGDFAFVFLQGAVFAFLVFCATLLDLRRRQF